MNWSAVVFLGELFLGLIWYATWGRKVYNGPIVEAGVASVGGDFAFGRRG